MTAPITARTAGLPRLCSTIRRRIAITWALLVVCAAFAGANVVLGIVGGHWWQWGAAALCVSSVAFSVVSIRSQRESLASVESLLGEG